MVQKIKCCEILSITLAYKCQRQMKIFSIEYKHWTLFRNMYTSFSKGDNLYDQYPKYLLPVTDTEKNIYTIYVHCHKIYLYEL